MAEFLDCDIDPTLPGEIATTERAVKEIMLIDFSPHPGLLDKLADLSRENFRIPQNQILYLIHKAVSDEADTRAGAISEDSH